MVERGCDGSSFEASRPPIPRPLVQTSIFEIARPPPIFLDTGDLGRQTDLAEASEPALPVEGGPSARVGQ